MQLGHLRISSPDARGNWSVATGVAEAGWTTGSAWIVGHRLKSGWTFGPWKKPWFLGLGDGVRKHGPSQPDVWTMKPNLVRISPVSDRRWDPAVSRVSPGDSAPFKLGRPLGTTRGSEGWARTW